MSEVGEPQTRPSPEDVQALQAEIAELKEACARERRQTERLRKVLRAEGRLAAAASVVALVLVLGPGLTRALRSWVSAFIRQGALPPSETGEVIIAIVRRRTMVWSVGIIIAALPAFLLWQQNGVLRNQLDDQRGQSQAIQRAQAVSALYDFGLNEKLRREALELFVTLERGIAAETDLANGQPAIDLHGANLHKLEIVGDGIPLDLSSAVLTNARVAGDLKATLLIDADLCGCDLSQANLSDVLLQGARYDGRTRWPKGGFDPEERGAVRSDCSDAYAKTGP